MDPYGKSNTIIRAASLIRGDRVNALREICENQKTISTAKLSKYLDEMQESCILDGIHFKKLVSLMENQND